ncbi:hypothetical protein SAMN04489712_104325 [Thermomonospora echinospora]|uniref:Uncharacterized protein n=1 Tax=Thermomonospora echinospora TaxID=1992 RepID=A0A1H5Z395_9ACTN|nr:hypothetical protein [Thermomonospora echinospora]SEG30801.1 hypothetical protein SAMN04489712_104325 [Thermomonospora echinospora]
MLAIIIGGGLVVILIIAAAFFVLLGNNDKSPTERLAAAARSLSSARALTLKGTFGTERIEGEVKVTASGRVTGPVTWSGDRVTLLSTDGNLFVKADRSYWSKNLTTTDVDDLPGSGEHWGKVEPTKLTFDFKQYATPSALAAKMRSITKFSVRSDVETTLRGRDVIKITTLSGTYYLSADDDELLRVESISPAVNADVTAQTGSAASATVNELRTRIGELKDAWDATKSPRLQKIDGCKNESAAGCTVRVQLWTSGASGGTTQVNVYVWITATTKTGRRLGDCTATATTTGLTSVWTQCRVSGPQWRSFYNTQNTTLRWWMQGMPVAIGATQSEIQAMQAALDRE